MFHIDNISAIIPFISTFISMFGRVQIILLVFLGFIIGESLSRHSGTKSQIKHSYSTNLSELVFNDIIISISPLSAIWFFGDYISPWEPVHTNSESIKRSLIFLILMDLVLYCWHYSAHKFKFLWRMHQVHHSDRSVNVTTTFRIHIGEVVTLSVLKILVVGLTGIGQALFLINESILLLFTIFHHSNIKFPFEDKISIFFITPSLHRTHHSEKRIENDSNYGTMLSVWDQIFGTLSQPRPVIIGLPGVKEMTFMELIRYGLISGIKSETIEELDYSKEQIANMIAESAYYRAKNRGFSHGDDQYDWFMAEQEIKKIYCK